MAMPGTVCQFACPQHRARWCGMSPPMSSIPSFGNNCEGQLDLPSDDLFLHQSVSWFLNLLKGIRWPPRELEFGYNQRRHCERVEHVIAGCHCTIAGSYTMSSALHDHHETLPIHYLCLSLAHARDETNWRKAAYSPSVDQLVG